MKFKATKLPGAFEIEPDRISDERGFFAVTWRPDEFVANGLDPKFDQCSIAFNKVGGTVRGMHYQIAPHEETKLVRCTLGAICDVLVDLRKDSPSYLEWIAVELTAENRKMLYVPANVAHGYYTLEDRSEVYYQMGGLYNPSCARGVRWNDTAFGVKWPGPVQVINSRDAQYPDFVP